MKKQIAVIFLAASLSVMSLSPANAAKFKNCSAVNKVYKGGVANSAGTVNQGGKTKHEPFVDAKLYKTLKSMDRDKDGIACEK
jgi:hypothetical protein